MPPRRSNRVAGRRGRDRRTGSGSAGEPTQGPEGNPVDPNIAAAINQAMSNMLPNLVAQVMEAIRSRTPNDPIPESVTSRVENHVQEITNGTNQADILLWLERFQKQKPRTFSSASTPVEAVNWIDHVEKIFAVFGCSDNIRVRLATYKLERDAHRWWQAWKQAHGGEEVMGTLSWADFRGIFYQQYFPPSERAACIREYDKIKQRDDETITDYLARFYRLARYAGAMAGSDADQTEHFKWSLNDRYRVSMINQTYENVAQAANAARNIELEWKDDLINKLEGNKKRTREGQPSNQGGKWKPRDNRQQGAHQGPDNSQRSAERGQSGAIQKTLCKFCGKVHRSDVCYKAMGACFLCGQLGHLRKDCKSGGSIDKGKDKPSTAGGRVFAMTANQAASADSRDRLEDYPG